VPFTPYIIAIKVYDSDDSVVEGVAVTLVNETTGESLVSGVTNSSGETIVDCANFVSGYSDGDFVQLTAGGTGTVGRLLRFKVVSNAAFVQVDGLDINYEV
jgi:hypothetical protein